MLTVIIHLIINNNACSNCSGIMYIAPVGLSLRFEVAGYNVN